VQPLFEYRDRFGGYETRVLELEGEGPPLVLLHGYADSADTWRHVLDRLGKRDRRAIAVDMPGFGTAAPFASGPMLPQLDRFAAAVVERVSSEHGADAIVVGNSLGGCVALRLAGAADMPARLPLSGVVPIAPAGLDMARWFGIVERDVLLRTLFGLPAPVPRRVVRDVVGRVYRTLAFADPGKVDSGVIDAFTGHFRDRAGVSRHLTTARRLLPELTDPFDLGDVSHPVMLVWGTRDRMVSPTGSDQILAALPDTRLELLDGCGHCPQIEDSQRIVELLLDFSTRPATPA
jgi:pimeloyl-ACP methyl ester carboxylesterase